MSLLGVPEAEIKQSLAALDKVSAQAQALLAALHVLIDKAGSEGVTITIKVGVILLLLVAPVSAQVPGLDTWAKPLPTQTERTIADTASWATVLVPVALDTKASWDAPDRTHAFVAQGERIAALYAVTWAAKMLIQRARPCAPACGRDRANTSFFSGHTALAFSTVHGPRLMLVLPLAVTTGGLRIAAGKHYVSDVAVGAAVGLLASRIR